MSDATVAIYARYSTDRQDARSIDDQLRRCSEYALKNKLTVVMTYADEAVSGSHTVRPELQRLLAEAGRTKGKSFSTILVDDLSRLSRDLWGMGSMVFGDLASLNVRVIDVMTGMASDAPQARQMFASIGMGNDFFLQMVKAETHRGLEGRALAGFSTGGRVYGYSSQKEVKPPDPEHPRSLLVVNEAEAQVVRRIFALFTEGTGFSAIARRFNDEGIPAPYDLKVAKKRGRGWGPSTIRAILQNERYVGRFVWNKRKFVRAPNAKNRTARLRPRSEWRTREAPELALIAPAVWQSVQSMFRTNKKRGAGRPLGATSQTGLSKPQVHLFSGIVRCDTCAAGMGVIGQRTKNGIRYITFGCTSHNTRGSAICANSTTVSEKKVNDSILGALRDALLSPGVLQRIVDRFNERVAEASKTPVTSEAVAIDRQIRESELAVNNLTDSLARAGWSDSIGDRLRDEEARLVDLRNRKTSSTATADRTKINLSHDQIRTYVEDMLGSVLANPERARAMLKLHVGTVPLVLNEEDPLHRYYAAEGVFDLGPIPLNGGYSDFNVAGAGFEPATFGL